MTELQTAVSAVAGVTWSSSAPTAAAVGLAWADVDETTLYVLLRAPRVTVRAGHPNPELDSTLVTAALASVAGWKASTVAEQGWIVAGRTVTVGVWIRSAGLTGNPTAPTPDADSNDTSIATTEFVTRAIAEAWGLGEESES
jgi:hypothetical protein